MIKAVTVNYEIVSSKFGKLLLQLKELWDYATKKEISLSRKKKGVGFADVQYLLHSLPLQ